MKTLAAPIPLVAWEQYRIIYLDGSDWLREIPVSHRQSHLDRWHRSGIVTRYVKTFYRKSTGALPAPQTPATAGKEE